MCQCASVEKHANANSLSPARAGMWSIPGRCPRGPLGLDNIHNEHMTQLEPESHVDITYEGSFEGRREARVGAGPTSSLTRLHPPSRGDRPSLAIGCDDTYAPLRHHDSHHYGIQHTFREEVGSTAPTALLTYQKS